MRLASCNCHDQSAKLCGATRFERSMASVCCCCVCQRSEESAAGRSVCRETARAPRISPRIRTRPRGLAASHAYRRGHLAVSSVAHKEYGRFRLVRTVQTPSHVPSMRAFHLKLRASPREILACCALTKLHTAHTSIPMQGDAREYDSNVRFRRCRADHCLSVSRDCLRFDCPATDTRCRQ